METLLLLLMAASLYIMLRIIWKTRVTINPRWYWRRLKTPKKLKEKENDYICKRQVH